MNTTISIEIFGHAQEAICSGCEGQACGSCSPGEKKATLDLVNEFSALVAASELCSYYTVAFYESTPENIKRLPDVQRLLSMAKLEPVVCIDEKIAYLGGFSPQGLLDELRKKHRG